MLDKIVSGEYKKLEAEFGGWGHPLPNMKEITEADVAKSDMFVYTPQFIGYRQINALDKLKAKGTGRHIACFILRGQNV